jgi:ELWxxDGT repeat protein
MKERRLTVKNHSTQLFAGIPLSLLLLFPCKSVASADSVPVSILNPDPFVQGMGATLDTENTHNITRIVRENISTENYREARVKVRYHNDGKPNTLVVYGLYVDTYFFDVTKIVVDDEYRVLSVTGNYQEAASPEAFEEESVCPDNTVDILLSTCEDRYPTAVSAIEESYDLAVELGYVAVKLLGDEENTASIKKWLSCSNLKYWGRVGHGNTTGILLDDGTLMYTDFNDMQSNSLENKILYFNSCQVFNDPLKSSILEAGAGKIIGGICNLLIGPSEEVFKCWNAHNFELYLPENGQTDVLCYWSEQCEIIADYPTTGCHGCDGPAEVFPGFGTVFPGRLEVEDYDEGAAGQAFYDLSPGNQGGAYREDDVDIAESTDVDGDYHVSLPEYGEWLRYSVTFLGNGLYTMETRVSSRYNQGAFHIQLDDQNVTGAVRFQSTGSDDNWTTIVLTDIPVTSGEKELKIFMEQNGFNLNWIKFTRQPPIRIPGKFEAENFDVGGEGIAYHDITLGNQGYAYRLDEDVDIEYSGGQENGNFNINHIESGEWLAYTVQIAETGVYDIEVRVAALNSNNVFSFSVNDDVLVDAIAFESTGSSQTWESIFISGIPLEAGRHVLKFEAVTSDFNINWFDFTYIGATPAPAWPLTKLKEINPVGSANPSYFFVLNDVLMFKASDGVYGSELWKTDGTEEGTVMLKDVAPGFASTYLYGYVVIDDTAFFPSNGSLWRTDGTEDATVIVRENISVSGQIINYNGTAIFRGIYGDTGSELWRSDGTEAGTVMIKDIRSDGGSYPNHMSVLNDVVIFSANDGVNGTELWKTDGTEVGTVMIRDINPVGSSYPSDFAVFNDIVVFTADNGEGKDLWRSDGTEAGTKLVKSINDSGNTWMSYEVVMGDFLFFVSYESVHGSEIWKTDGTTAGTELLRDINSSGCALPRQLTPINGTLFFAATDSENGRELWKSNGTESGTVLVKDINPSGSSSPNNFTQIGDMLYFTANDGFHLNALWKTDGTSDGTVMVKDISPGATTWRTITGFTVVNDMLFFTADDGVHGAELWKSDGTEEGTFMIGDINPDKGGYPRLMIEYNNALFFYANDAGCNNEVWVHRLDSLLSQGKPVAASSVKNNGTLPDNALDGNPLTHFSTSQGDRQWITVDLEKISIISEVKLVWGDAYAVAYDVLVSEDGVSYDRVYSEFAGNGGVDAIAVSAFARFVRIDTTAGARDGYTLFELGVFGY